MSILFIPNIAFNIEYRDPWDVTYCKFVVIFCYVLMWTYDIPSYYIRCASWLRCNWKIKCIKSEGYFLVKVLKDWQHLYYPQYKIVYWVMFPTMYAGYDHLIWGRYYYLKRLIMCWAVAPNIWWVKVVWFQETEDIIKTESCYFNVDFLMRIS